MTTVDPVLWLHRSQNQSPHLSFLALLALQATGRQRPTQQVRNGLITRGLPVSPAPPLGQVQPVLALILLMVQFSNVITFCPRTRLAQLKNQGYDLHQLWKLTWTQIHWQNIHDSSVWKIVSFRIVNLKYKNSTWFLCFDMRREEYMFLKKLATHFLYSQAPNYIAFCIGTNFSNVLNLFTSNDPIWFHDYHPVSFLQLAHNRYTHIVD